MIRYYQLTPEILLEYIYEGDPKLNEDGIWGNEKDICDEKYATMLLKSNPFSSKYLCFKNKSEGEGLDGLSNLVLPLNNNETQFVVAKSKYQNFYSKINTSNIFSSKNGSEYIYENIKIPIFIASNPLTCIAEGCGIILNNPQILNKNC